MKSYKGLGYCNNWIILLLLIHFQGISQQDLGDRYEREIATHEELKRVEADEFLKYDYSSVFSNQHLSDGNMFSTYVGVFGANNTRIEFHLRASKYTEVKYLVTGVSKLGNNVRSLKGFFEVKDFYYSSDYTYFMTFAYDLREPGDREGDGHFQGIGTIVFNKSEENVSVFWGSSGDRREFANVFVGIWKKYNSANFRECIFSFSPVGINAKLPFRSYIYKEFEDDDECRCSYEFEDEYMKYGWSDFNQYKKSDWWLNHSLEGW